MHFLYGPAINCYVTINSTLVHSFIPDISIAPLQVHYCSEASASVPTTALILSRS